MPYDLQPDNFADERRMLRDFLNHYRAILRYKAEGLTEEQLVVRLAPSTLSIGGILNHMALVEHGWFYRGFTDGPILEPWASAPWDDDEDWDFNDGARVPAEELFRRYDEAVERSIGIVDGIDDLDTASLRSTEEEGWSLRWILVHMIEEYARHCGHADLIRESIDGQKGDPGE